MDSVDREYVKKCKFVVASGIFDGYDTPHQPSNVSARSRNLFRFLMVVDEKSLNYTRQKENVTEDSNKGKRVGLWHLFLLRNPPYDELRRNGKVHKILTHKLFLEAQYSIWIDGKMELIVDPLLILESLDGAVLLLWNWRLLNASQAFCAYTWLNVFTQNDVGRQLANQSPLHLFNAQTPSLCHLMT